MKRKNGIVPDWVFRNLKTYGNCACGYEIVRKYGKNKLLKVLKENGYECSLRIVKEPTISNSYFGRKKKYPIDAYYILEVTGARRSI